MEEDVVCTVVKSKGKISQNFVAFSENMNFTSNFQIEIALQSINYRNSDDFQMYKGVSVYKTRVVFAVIHDF
jgi:hypothetical protein